MLLEGVPLPSRRGAVVQSVATVDRFAARRSPRRALLHLSRDLERVSRAFDQRARHFGQGGILGGAFEISNDAFVITDKAFVISNEAFVISNEAKRVMIVPADTSFDLIEIRYAAFETLFHWSAISNALIEISNAPFEISNASFQILGASFEISNGPFEGWYAAVARIGIAVSAERNCRRRSRLRGTSACVIRRVWLATVKSVGVAKPGNAEISHISGRRPFAGERPPPTTATRVRRVLRARRAARGPRSPGPRRRRRCRGRRGGSCRGETIGHLGPAALVAIGEDVGGVEQLGVIESSCPRKRRIGRRMRLTRWCRAPYFPRAPRSMFGAVPSKRTPMQGRLDQVRYLSAPRGEGRR